MKRLFAVSFVSADFYDIIQFRCVTQNGLEEILGRSSSRQSLLAEGLGRGWATLDPANVAMFYAKGPHTFFDIAPLKYDSWDAYEKRRQERS